MRRISSREAKRMMKRMGLNMRELQDVKEVVFKTSTKEIIINKPEITILDLQGQRIFQVVGGKMTEKNVERNIEIPGEDIQLVAQQAGVSLERAKLALKQTQGDLAQAILFLTQK